MRHGLRYLALAVKLFPLSIHQVAACIVRLVNDALDVNFPGGIDRSLFEVLTTENVHVSVVAAANVVTPPLGQLAGDFELVPPPE